MSLDLDIDVPAARQPIPRKVCPAGRWPATITAAAVREDPTDPTEIEAIKVTFDIAVREAGATSAESYTLEKLYGWDDEGKVEFANLCHDAKLSGKVTSPADLVGRKVLALTRTRGGRRSAFVNDTLPVPAPKS